MTVARQETNWAAHLYLALLALGLTTIYLALAGTEGEEEEEPRDKESGGTPRSV